MPTTTEVPVINESELAILAPDRTLTPLYEIRDREITIPDDLTREQWFSGLRLLKRTQEKYKEILAAYIGYGQAKFGKDAVDDSLHQLEFDWPTVQQAMDINTIPLTIRQPSLNGDHYIVLARSELKNEKERGKWARIANDQNLTPSQLKTSIQEGEVVTTAVAKQRQHGVITIDGVRQEFEIWLNRMGGQEGILKLDPDTVRDIIKDIKPMSQLYSDLSSADLSAPRKRAAPKSKKKSKQPSKSKPKSQAKGKSKAKKKK